MAQDKKVCRHQTIIQSAKKTCTMLENVPHYYLNVRYARDRPWLLGSMCAILKIVPGY